MKPQTLFEKVWDAHLVRKATAETPATLYIDLHLIHEVTSPQAFTMLRERDLKVRRPEKTMATMDHSTPTTPRRADGGFDFVDAQAAAQIEKLKANCQEFGIELHEIGSAGQGVVHIIGPGLGATQPGMTIVCGDSHTATHGAFGALAFGIGTSEVSHVLASQCLLQSQPKTFAIEVDGQLRAGVTAKDIILAIIAKIGVGGGTGQVIEYRGSTIRALSMDERMTVCNMSIEAGARAGMVAPDQTTFDYLSGRPRAPQGEAWERAVADWRTLVTEPGATFDQTIRLDAGAVEPMVTYGTNPGMVAPISGRVPERPG
ncbi:MAG: aconitase family protein, partial [Vicinamibacteria bacterium]|nr:aconitase family protein [Vicinamibacteria bacterium]